MIQQARGSIVARDAEEREERRKKRGVESRGERARTRVEDACEGDAGAR